MRATPATNGAPPAPEYDDEFYTDDVKDEIDAPNRTKQYERITAGCVQKCYGEDKPVNGWCSR